MNFLSAGDTGGIEEHFVSMVRTLERYGVSALIIEDKIGLKRNSLFGTQVSQQQDDIQTSPRRSLPANVPRSRTIS